MDEATLKRLRFLVQPAAWAYHESLGDLKADVETAWIEFGDVRLVAAYVLETVCSDARQKAADTASQTKRIKVGPIEIEKATNTVNKGSTQADDWCGRAAFLRGLVRQESYSTLSTVAIPLEVGF